MFSTTYLYDLPDRVGPFPFFYFLIKRAHAEASLSLVSHRFPIRVGTAVDPNI